MAKLLHPHFLKEEEFALPALGLLPQLAAGNVTPEMGDILPMTARLKAELHQMLKEHQAIVAALRDLVDAAEEEHKLEYARIAEKLMLHAQTEKDVLYPAAIMIGEYVQLKLKQ